MTRRRHAVRDRSSGFKTTRRRKSAGLGRQGASEDFATLIDTAFRRQIKIAERGKQTRVSVFAAILHQLWKKEMSGDCKAANVRLGFQRFAEEQCPKQEREIIVIGGLPDRGVPKTLEDDGDSDHE